MSLLSMAIWLQAAWCGTDEYVRKVDPDWELRSMLLEAARPIIEAQQRTGQVGCTPSRYIIPVVFHIIHSGGTDSISYQRVWNQMLRLHEDFRRIPETEGFASAGADTEIEFSLATKDPNGNPTTGVVYWRYDQPPLNWTTKDFCRDTQDQRMKQVTGWDRTRYLNIWIVPRICTPSGSNPCGNCNSVAGYAFFPSASAVVYGAVIDSRFFWGSTSTRSGRTLVHELGHNLNLAHPFQSGCGSTNCATSGDGVCDTPPTAVVDGNFSVRRQNTCTNDPPPDRPDNMRNYMDYVSDVDMTYFSFGQRARAWAAIQSSASRLAPLVQPTRPQETGTGAYGHVKAYFAASHRVGCVGQPIQFFSYSMGVPHIFQWDFGGGIPDNPSISCPTVTFPSPGTYTVSLIVENLSGRRDTLQKVNYITIHDTVYALPYVEDFEGNTFPPAHSYIDNPDGRRTWERFRSTSPPRGAYGASPTSMRLLCFNYSYYGERDGWVTPPIDLRPYANSTQSIRLRFSWAYACLEYSGQVGSYTSYPLDYIDSLRILVSTDCGATWTPLWESGGRDLSTHPSECLTASGSITSTSQFLPDATTWKTDSLLLNAYKGQVIRIRFEGISGWGNNLFLDDISVDTISAVTSQLVDAYSPLQAFISGGILRFHTESTLPFMHVSLYDIQGRQLWSDTLRDIPSGKHQLSLPTPLAEGVYFLRLDTGKETLSLRYWHSP